MQFVFSINQPCRRVADDETPHPEFWSWHMTLFFTKVVYTPESGVEFRCKANNSFSHNAVSTMNQCMCVDVIPSHFLLGNSLCAF